MIGIKNLFSQLAIIVHCIGKGQLATGQPASSPELFTLEGASESGMPQVEREDGLFKTRVFHERLRKTILAGEGVCGFGIWNGKS